MRCHFTQFTGGTARRIFHDAFDIGILVNVCQFQHLSADIQQMAIGMLHKNASVSRDGVQVGRRHANSIIEINGVEAPCHQGLLGINQRSFDFLQTFKHAIERLNAWPHTAIRIRAIEVTNVGVFPNRTIHGMAMGLNKTR